jgi:hypothetical protein
MINPTVTRNSINQRSVDMNLDIEDFYTIINAMTDGCGCPDCSELVAKLKKSLADNLNKVGA